MFEWRRDNSSQQEELLQSLGEMRGDLSQLMDNFSNLTKKVEQYKTEMDAIASNLAPTTQNLTGKMDEPTDQYELLHWCPTSMLVVSFVREVSCWLETLSEKLLSAVHLSAKLERQQEVLSGTRGRPGDHI